MAKHLLCFIAMYFYLPSPTWLLIFSIISYVSLPPHIFFGIYLSGLPFIFLNNYLLKSKILNFDEIEFITFYISCFFFFWSYLRNLCLTQVSHFKKYFLLEVLLASLVSQTIKNLSAVQETQVWSLRREELLENGMAISSFSSFIYISDWFWTLV